MAEMQVTEFKTYWVIAENKEEALFKAKQGDYIEVQIDWEVNA